MNLKPCPFCGEMPEIHNCDGETMIRCENIHCIYVAAGWYGNEEQAIEAWNRRTYDDRP